MGSVRVRYQSDSGAAYLTFADLAAAHLWKKEGLKGWMLRTGASERGEGRERPGREREEREGTHLRHVVCDGVRGAALLVDARVVVVRQQPARQGATQHTERLGQRVELLDEEQPGLRWPCGAASNRDRDRNEKMYAGDARASLSLGRALSLALSLTSVAATIGAR